MMERGEFDQLVERIERRFDGRTDALTAHTWWWLVLGYAVVIFVSLLLVGGGLAAFIAGIMISGPGLLLLLVGGALVTFGLGQVGALTYVDLFEPRGRELAADEAPELHKLIGLLAEEIGAPLPDKIILNDDYNAAIIQHPRLGIFGWPKSRLILGVPLLLATSPKEIASVLAHECGHLSMKHGRQGNRIYLMHQSWEKLFQKLQQNAGSGFIRIASTFVVKFLNWYWPRFHARAFVLSRHNEFTADRRAVEATNPGNAASALWRIDVGGYMLENEFWKELWEEAAERAEPPDDLCSRMRTAFLVAPESPDAERWCDYALQRVANNEDTHPSLSDRLSAIGVDPEEKRRTGFPPLPDVTAAEGLLTDDLPGIEADINELWRRNVRAIWSDRHRRIAAIRATAENAPSTVADESVSVAELWNQTRDVLDAEGLEAAEPQLRQLLAADPDHAGATFALGQLRLNQGYDDGQQLLEHVVSRQTAEWTQPAGAVLERHLAATGQREAMKTLRSKLDEFERARADGEKERSEVRRRDSYIPHGLSTAEIEKLRASLADQKPCRHAWLVQKELRHYPDERLYVLCVDAGQKSGTRSQKNDNMIAAMMLNVDLPGRLFVVNPTGEFRSVARRLMKRGEHKVFERDQHATLTETMSSSA